MKSIEELERLKNETLEEIRLRSSYGGPRVVVGMGTCGIASGARDTMLAIIDELRKRKKLDVTVTETGCIGLCSQEPIVTVEIPGEPEVVYGKVDANKARQIVLSHLINHQPINEWVINAEEMLP